MTMISFVIANYNYEAFVREAIESALASDWPQVEVIVVDDGSVDGSPGVIRAFGERITAIFQPNGGQRVANNTGFDAANGDIVVFLDADDTVEPAFARKVAEAWRPGVAKVQVQMIRTDAEGRSFGAPFPAWPQVPGPAQIRSWMLATSEYPTPPGSGNAYSRDFLTRFFPIGLEHDGFTDSTTLVMAPLLGDVVTIREPLVRYRRHGGNDSNLIARPTHFGREVERAMKRQATAAAICTNLAVPPPPAGTLRRSWELLQLRVASLVLAPQHHPLPGDSRWTALRDAVFNLPRTSCQPLPRRLIFAGWAVATLLAPAPLARILVQKRFGERG